MSTRGSRRTRFCEQTVFAIPHSFSAGLKPVETLCEDLNRGRIVSTHIVSKCYVKDISEILLCQMLRIVYFGPLGVIRKINMYITKSWEIVFFTLPVDGFLKKPKNVAVNYPARHHQT